MPLPSAERSEARAQRSRRRRSKLCGITSSDGGAWFAGLVRQADLDALPLPPASQEVVPHSLACCGLNASRSGFAALRLRQVRRSRGANPFDRDGSASLVAKPPSNCEFGSRKVVCCDAVAHRAIRCGPPHAHASHFRFDALVAVPSDAWIIRRGRQCVVAARPVRRASSHAHVVAASDSCRAGPRAMRSCADSAPWSRPMRARCMRG